MFYPAVQQGKGTIGAVSPENVSMLNGFTDLAAQERFFHATSERDRQLDQHANNTEKK